MNFAEIDYIGKNTTELTQILDAFATQEKEAYATLNDAITEYERDFWTKVERIHAQIGELESGKATISTEMKMLGNALAESTLNAPERIPQIQSKMRELETEAATLDAQITALNDYNVSPDAVKRSAIDCAMIEYEQAQKDKRSARNAIKNYAVEQSRAFASLADNIVAIHVETNTKDTDITAMRVSDALPLMIEYQERAKRKAQREARAAQQREQIRNRNTSNV